MNRNRAEEIVDAIQTRLSICHPNVQVDIENSSLCIERNEQSLHIGIHVKSQAKGFLVVEHALEIGTPDSIKHFKDALMGNEAGLEKFWGQFNAYIPRPASIELKNPELEVDHLARVVTEWRGFRNFQLLVQLNLGNSFTSDFLQNPTLADLLTDDALKQIWHSSED